MCYRIFFLLIFSSGCISDPPPSDAVEKTPVATVQDEFEQQQNLDSSTVADFNDSLLHSVSMTGQLPGSSRNARLTLISGTVFSPTVNSLFVKHTLTTGTFVDVYTFHGNVADHVFSQYIWNMVYTNDTIRDVNGDDLPDMVLSWYPVSGCCPRDVNDVYLTRPGATFSEPVELVNPVFFPEKKLVVGRLYGYSAPLYTFRWKGEMLDTLEYIYFNPEEEKRLYLRRRIADTLAAAETLHYLPVQYIQAGYDD
jgi:hypothetical protein